MKLKLSVLLASAVLLAACGRPSAPGNGPGAAAGGPPGVAGNSKTALAVDVVHPNSSEIPEVLETAGGLYAWQEVDIGADVSGYRVSEVLVDVGDQIKKGQVLAKLDEVLLREGVSQAQASLEEAKAMLTQSQSAARRGETLQQTGLISKQDFETLSTNAATAAAKLASAKSQLQSANQKFDYATIRASDDGVISQRTVAPGQIANASTTLFKLIRQSRVEWRAEISANDIGRIHRGMHAAITRADGTKANGVVRTVSPGLDSSLQRGIAYIDLKLEPLVRPGMYVTGSIQLAQAKTLTVPLTAVTVRDGFSYVFTVAQDGAVRQERITVGQLLNDKLAVLSGLTVDDFIVASGSGFLHDGDVVQITNRDIYSANGTPAPAALDHTASASKSAKP